MALEATELAPSDGAGVGLMRYRGGGLCGGGDKTCRNNGVAAGEGVGFGELRDSDSTVRDDSAVRGLESRVIMEELEEEGSVFGGEYRGGGGS